MAIQSPLFNASQIIHTDEKTEFETGATRDDSTGKGRPSLISPVLIHRVSKHLAAGEEHYGKDNWTKGMPYCRTADSLIRHIFQWLAGDDSEDHLAAIVCNTMFLMHYEEDWNQSEVRLTDGENPRNATNPLDDRPEAFKKILPSILTSLTSDAKLEKPPAEATHESLKQESWTLCIRCKAPVPPGTVRCIECTLEGRRGS
jgi:hypothetical protein